MPTADDILLFSGMVPATVTETLPGGEGPPSPPPPSPPPPPYSNTSVTFPSTGNANYLSSYAGIRILNGYGGTVTFPTDQGFGVYTQNSGATSQAEDTAITVTSAFGWIGGAINTSSNAATMELHGAGQIGEDFTSLSSGSKFVFESGADVTQAGILTILNGVGIDVLDGGIFRQQQLINQVNNKPEVKAEGKVLAKGEIYDNGGKLPSVLIEGGTLWVKKGGLEVTGKIPGSVWGVKLNTATSKLYITNDGALTAAEDVLMNDGYLRTFTAPGGPPQVASIIGTLHVTGGRIELGNSIDQEVASFSTLHVTKTLLLTGGSFWPKVDGADTGHRDIIQTGKTITTDSAFKVEGTVSSSPNQAAGKTWYVLLAEEGFTNTTDKDPTWTNDIDWVQYRSSNAKKWYIHRKAE